MKNLLRTLLVFLSMAVAHAAPPANHPGTFEFPESRMGRFAQAWFGDINAEDGNRLRRYDPDGEWADHFSLLRHLSARSKGITPVQLSYETDGFISIYAKENEGAWVVVNLGLDDDQRITAMGIKKSYRPNDYALRRGLSRAQAREIVDGIADAIGNRYVLESRRAEYAGALRTLLESGKYDAIAQGDLLAETLTRDLVELSKDKHLQVIAPSRRNEVAARFGEHGSDSMAPTRHAGPAHAGEFRGEAISSSVLEDNVGLLKVSRFVGGVEADSERRHALSDLADTRAIIVDLRQSGGGDAGAVADLLDYFLADRDVSRLFPSLATVVRKDGGAADGSGPRMALGDKPLFVLTSSKTISAAEAFAYDVKSARRGMVIGENTAGAGYRVDVFDLPHGFYFVNSIYSDFDADKGEGWQGEGVSPDVRVSSGDALEAALSRVAPQR